MTAELAWITVAGKRVLPVLGHAGTCGTSGARHTRINCAFYDMAYGDCLALNNTQDRNCEADIFPNDTIFITEDQLLEYLGRKLVGSL